MDKRRSHTSGEISAKCLECICWVESKCDPNIGCRMDEGSWSCGPYQIKEDYWIDSGKPGKDWKSCANDKACAEKCIKAYMARYATKETLGREPTCEDYSRIHNGGPKGCERSKTIDYWNKVKKCLGGKSA